MNETARNHAYAGKASSGQEIIRGLGGMVEEAEVGGIAPVEVDPRGLCGVSSGR